MTFSILARDPETGEMGCAAATGNLAVGAWVLRARAGCGLVATQGISVSTLWGDEAINGLAVGECPREIVERLVGSDGGASFRQLSLLDTQGRTDGWTGADNLDVKGHNISPNLAVAGNWLANENVLTVLAESYLDTEGAMAERLLFALDAAAKAGSDARGTVSAAIKVVSPDKPPVDLRIDHSETPVMDLISLYARTNSEEYREFLARLPTVSDPQRH